MQTEQKRQRPCKSEESRQFSLVLLRFLTAVLSESISLKQIVLSWQTAVSHLYAIKKLNFRHLRPLKRKWFSALWLWTTTFSAWTKGINLALKKLALQGPCADKIYSISHLSLKIVQKNAVLQQNNKRTAFSR